MLSPKIVFLLTAIASIAITSPAHASDWGYGCKGALPVFNERTVIIFNRNLLVFLPKAWLKGTLSALASNYTDADVVIAKTVDENSGLAPTMVFRRLDHPDQKLTLTEKSSKANSDVREKALGPRLAQTTIYTKHYQYVSDFGYAGPFDIKLDCINYELSAPIRKRGLGN